MTTETTTKKSKLTLAKANLNLAKAHIELEALKKAESLKPENLVHRIGALESKVSDLFDLYKAKEASASDCCGAANLEPVNAKEPSAKAKAKEIVMAKLAEAVDRLFDGTTTSPLKITIHKS